MAILDTINKSPRQLLEKATREKALLFAALKKCDEQETADSLFNFTVTTYHVRDWLIRSHKALESEINAAVGGSEALRACRDLANASKHVELDGPPYKTHPPIVSSANHSISSSTQWASLVKFLGVILGTENRRWRLKVTYDDGHRVRMEDIATEALEAWHDFFKRHNL